jgi:peptidoglycan hydrolase CwlO-like protein
MFLSFLLNNKSLIAIALLLAAIAGEYTYIVILKSEKATLVAEKAQLKTMLDESQANLKQLQNDIQAQNDAIDKLKKDGDARVAKGAAEVKKAQDTAAEYKKRADELLGRKPPQNVPKCDAANALINEELQHAHK